MIKNWFDFVFCCLTPDQQNQVALALKDRNPGLVYHVQENLTKEKHGYRCNTCGKYYPFLQLDYQDLRTDPKTYSKPAGTVHKYKKAATSFHGHHYFAQSKNTLQKFEADAAHNIRQTDTIPIMRDVQHTILSQHEQYIATETFRGTIEIIDTQRKLPVAKKQKTPINGAFLFTPDHKLMYFFEDAIRCWDFLENKDTIVWRIPEHWKSAGDAKNQIHIVCKNILFNRLEEACVFAFDAREVTYVVSIKNMVPEKVLQLPAAPAGCKLVFTEEANQYTLTGKDGVNIYDSTFHIVERLTPPHIIQIHDGGRMFPITRHISAHPNKTFLSPDGKWLLLDYFHSIILLGREDRQIHFCLYSYTGKTAQNMGFIDYNHFWYTWGDTTYIQQIEA